MMRSSPGQIEDFSQSVIWKDMCEELDVWLDRIRNELENLDLSASHRSLDQLSGSAKALRNVKMILETLLNLSEEDEKGESNV
jgi:hypothetical protein